MLYFSGMARHSW